MHGKVGVIGYGVYVPETRLKREEIGSAWGTKYPQGERSVCSYDEDAISMGIEASLNAFQTVKRLGIKPEHIESIYSASSTIETMNGLFNVILAKTIGAPSETNLFYFGNSHNAGASSWLACIDALNSQRVDHALTVTSSAEKTPPGSELEPYMGAGATAFILGKKNTAATIENVYNYTGFFIDYIVRSEVVQVYQQSFVVNQGYQNFIPKSVEGLLKKTKLSITDFNHVILQAPNERMLNRIGRKLGCNENQISGSDILQSLGYLGINAVFIGLAQTLSSAEPNEDILMASYGSGTSTAFHLKTNSETRKFRIKFDDLMRNKKYIDYFTFLRNQKFIKKGRELR